MEEYIGVVAFVLATLFSIVLAIVKKGGNDRERTTPEEAAPLPWGTPKKDTMPAGDGRHLAQNHAMPEEGRSSLGWVATTREAATSRAKQDRVVCGAGIDSVSNAPDIHTESIAEAFDLRQAVIYAEIITPKFSEEA